MSQNMGRKNGIGFYFSIVAILFAILGLIAYVVTMLRQENLMISIIVVTVMGILAGIVTCVRQDYLCLLTVLSAAMYLLGGLLFLATQLENIGYALYNTNIGDGILPSFIVGMICYGISAVSGILAACTLQKKDVIL